MNEILKIETQEDLNDLLSPASGYVLVLKHSTRCPVSSAALKEFKDFASSAQVKTAILLVVENRTLSNLLAEKVSVRHESPQVILLKDGASLWNVSHGAITKNRINSELKKFIS